jgi:hypothetical protein
MYSGLQTLRSSWRRGSKQSLKGVVTVPISCDVSWPARVGAGPIRATYSRTEDDQFETSSANATRRDHHDDDRLGGVGFTVNQV